jgi:predicted DNA-binding protein (MmcQ/YjbR family)
MTFKALRDYCRSKPGAVEEFPFGEETLVFKVMGKIFALTGVERLPLAVNLKCDPDLAVELRDRWPAVQPGYHMNKAHWNTVELDSSIPADKVREMIDHSYGLVVAGLKRSERQRLEELTRAG